MNAFMPREVDRSGSFGGNTHSSFQDGRSRTGERDNAAIMIGVAGAIEYDHTGHCGNGRFQGGHAGKVAAFRKIGYAFDEDLAQTALAFGRLRFITRLPSRMASATWLMPKRRGISR
jgi:hypothetical protein